MIHWFYFRSFLDYFNDNGNNTLILTVCYAPLKIVSLLQ